ncbi:MAG: ribonucleoside triphosphate reductase [Candidatus Omnitrophica bacterium]|nr:ribonucleoside triphosphate reductase [Candidatus Omnitrophota bacterium]MDD5081206.1 ribonucleoside triphosphate reductase [Candidatus Omnitrophota bacterium]MDD5441385.1 ribonucleoside triphosphate reductase [Candidatus Omnitrophota bacterium]
MESSYIGFEKILKRNGTEESFTPQKIVIAIKKAGEATGEFDEKVARRLTIKVLNLVQHLVSDRVPTVEELQDIVEEVLLASPYKKTAKAYVIYRDQHSRIREISSRFNVDLMDQYLLKLDWQVNENSNMSYSLQGLNNYVSSEISKMYWLNKVYTKKIRDAHINGDMHIHDLSSLSAYCVGWDLQDLLTQGFQGAVGKIESRPAKHLRTALGQIVNFFYTLQGEAAGAQAFSNFDTLLAPFIHYDNLNYEQVKQALQEFLFNINVPTRVGFQTPFTNITFDLNVPSYYANECVIIGGKPQDKTYKEFQKELDMFNKAFLEVMLEGDAKGRVFTFPIPTYNISRDFDWDNETLALLWEVTAKYGIPYFANFVNSDMNPEDARSMCCRLRIDNRELRRRGGGLFGASPLTGSVGVVTINMVRLGYLAKNEEEFFQLLNNVMETARESLEMKRKVLEKLTQDGLYPYMKFYLRNIYKRFNCYWKNHFSTIGLIGMNEAVMNLLGVNLAGDQGNIFAQKVLDYMRDKLTKFQEETGNNYNLEATPAEGTGYRLAKLDKEWFPNIKCANKTDVDGGAPIYTNSSQLPVNYTSDLFEMLDLQDELQSKYTGGTVLHLYVGERVKDTKALRGLIRKICQSYKLPYFSITPTFSVCQTCGYIPGEKHECPKCGNTCEVFSRVVGYLRPIRQWNVGKKAEFSIRKFIEV